MSGIASMAGRKEWPGQILCLLPLTLFFPVAWMYLGYALFLLALTVSGEWSQKWQRVRSHPMSAPIVFAFAISLVTMLIHGQVTSDAALGFLHYQIYFFLLCMISIGPGSWQQRAIHYFFAGALIAATLFYLASFKLLPENTLFRSYVIYQGNKSILLGLLLAISSAWMLQQWFQQKNYAVWRGLALAYVVLALIVGSKSRTAALLLLLLSVTVYIREFRFQQWMRPFCLAIVLTMFACFIYAWKAPAPVTCLAKEMHDQYQMSGVEILKNRAVCTVQQVRDFGQHGSVNEDGMRLQIYQNTWELIAQSPWTGHGIAQWLPLYQNLAKGSMSEKMTTPHNDYLLYWCEMGILGLGSLLYLWGKQLLLARSLAKAGAEHATPLYLITISMMFAGAFNAILRDTLFGLAMLILLAIPLVSLPATQQQVEK